MVWKKNEAQHDAEGQPLLLTAAPPSKRQIRLAIVVVAFFFVALIGTLPFKDVDLLHLSAFVPMLQVAITINDGVTSALLFSQFAITRRRSLLVLACGYLFTSLIVISYALTFP